MQISAILLTLGVFACLVDGWDGRRNGLLRFAAGALGWLWLMQSLPIGEPNTARGIFVSILSTVIAITVAWNTKDTSAEKLAISIAFTSIVVSLVFKLLSLAGVQIRLPWYGYLVVVLIPALLVWRRPAPKGILEFFAGTACISLVFEALASIVKTNWPQGIYYLELGLPVVSLIIGWGIGRRHRDSGLRETSPDPA
ncbi:MAG: hypothetical protein JNJ45_04610 [Chthonomonas sp.]|nr:hypothetical protein [Chthonomonas sp.]